MRDKKLAKLKRASFPPLLKSFWAWIAGLTLLSYAYTLGLTWIFGLRFPYGLPLFGDLAPFWDFTVFRERFLHFGTPSFWAAYNYPFTYPAPTALVFELFFKSPRPLTTYLLVCFVAVAFGAWLLARQLISRGAPSPLAAGFALTVALTSWPIALLINRANIEGAVAILLAAGVIAVLRERCWLGGTLIALAGAMKLFPFVLLALLLSKRRYKEFAWSICVAVLVTIASLATLGPTVSQAQQHISEGLRYFQAKFAVPLLPGLIGGDHSLLTWVKIPAVVISAWLHRSTTASTAANPHGNIIAHSAPLLLLCLEAYFLLAAAFGILAYLLNIRRLPLLNQALALAICSVLLPPVSFDYTLVHLYLPFALFCIYVFEHWKSGSPLPQGVRLCFICFAVIFTPGAYLTLVIRFAGPIRALVLTLLLFTVMRYRFPWPHLDQHTRGPRRLRHTSPSLEPTIPTN